MKRIISIILVVLLAAGLVTVFSSCNRVNDTVSELRATYTRDYEGTVLNVFNWAEYISDGQEGSLDVIAAFEKITGIDVKYSMYDSNEIMYSKIQSGSVNYDVIIPSDYMIERMQKEDLLRELDYSKITNYDLILDEYKGLYFDIDEKYTVAYNVGMVGLIYNTTMVEGTPDSWSIMWDDAYDKKVITFNNSRDGFMIAQMVAGVDVNSENKADWDLAADYLKRLHPKLQGYFMDETFNKMESGNAAIAPYYAGDFLTMRDENEDLAIVFPKEGTNIFVDSMCIPKTCQNYEAALMFINFMLEPEVALANAEYLCYATPNSSVLENPDYSLKDEEAIYPSNMEEIKVYYYHDLPAEIRSYFEQLWLQIKGE